MMDDEVDIFLLTEDGKKYPVDVPKEIKYNYLKEKLKKFIFKNEHFYILHQNKKYNRNTLNEILYFNPGDIIVGIKTVVNECFTKNVCFHLNANVNEADMKTVPLTGILLICFMRYIAKKIINVEVIQSSTLKSIIYELKKDMDLSNDPQKDIKANLSQNEGSNLITYKNYINQLINEKDIQYLINLFDNNTQKEIIAYWSQLSKYEEFNQLFEKEFTKAIEQSYFDYSLIGVSIYQQNNRKKYLKELEECENRVVKYLFHGSQKDPISKIITNGFLYTRKPFYGMGIYFSDMLDYVSFYSGGNNYKTRRQNFGIILPVGETFSCVGAEIYYDNDLKKKIYDGSYNVKELDHFPSYDEIKKNYKNKMVPKNGVHFVRVEPEKGQVIQSETLIISEKKKGTFIGNEYVITEMDQILPLYGLTLKRNEYFVIWRDPNFKGNNEFTNILNNAKMYIYKNENMNAYIIPSTEEALELIKRKRFNKIILISSIGLDLSGKTFVETARQILGFNVMVLFFSKNQTHFKWLQNFPNALYTNNINFYQKYIKNYNKQGLINLKNEIEQAYKINLKFTDDFLKFPKFVNSKEYKDLTFEEINPNFRRIIIKNKAYKKLLFMNINGVVEFKSYEDNDTSKLDTENMIWYMTLVNNEITLFSNGFYLSIDLESQIAKGYEYMVRWKYKLMGDKLMLYYEDNNYILTLDGNTAFILPPNNNNINSQLFKFVDLSDII